ncbi:hypothetical protein [Pedococcus sp.]|jgi:hypothetical protein|uniref:hypothetical protein n=1 Tax=Pedococcus sp. TaxID=2860345 RepID=UPI002E107FF0|nr:hypothetical protein [Pedococcus sp.]
MSTDVVRPQGAVPEHQRSHWSTVALAAALLVWVGGVLLHVLGVLAPGVAVVGLVAGVAAAARERRPIWRVAAVGATLASAVALSLYALVLTGTVSWPPTG